MATVANKKFIAYDACGTATKQKAIYKVVDSDGFSYESILIDASIHDEGTDEQINAAIEAIINA